MLRIRNEQMQAFGNEADREFQQRLVRHVAKMFPKKATALGPAGLRARVRRGVTKARKHGFATERHIATYVDLTMAVGMDFDRLPWAQPVLLDREADAAARIRRLQVKARRHGAGGAT